MAFLRISHLQKTFDAHVAVKDFSLDVESGEFITFLGPSGCGKTTILRMLAGFETPSQGRILMDGRDVTWVPTSQRNVGMVFQSYALFPNMTVAENIGFGLRIGKLPRAERDARVQELLSLIKLEDLAQRYPWQMSGGQQQRVALARALSTQPKILLLDEPLSALDAKIRVSLRDEIRALQKALQITTVFVTHDQEEALTISDRIVVFRDGKVEQVGTPSEVYNTPQTAFVASFIGTLNQWPATVEDAAQGLVRVGGQVLRSGHSMAALLPSESVTVAIRPEAIRLQTAGAAEAPETHNLVQAEVEDVSFLGNIVRMRCRWNGLEVCLDVFNGPQQPLPRSGSAVSLVFTYESLLVLRVQ